MKKTLDNLRERAPSFSLPKLGRTAEIEIFVIHNSHGAEDYFFIFDFEEFVERSREGMFVRPALKVWGGRSDFDKRQFARQFRTAFSQEFDVARKILSTEKQAKKSWFGWSLGKELVGASLSGFVANVVLLLATSAGRAVWAALPKPSFLSSASPERELEKRIVETKDNVETALAELEVVLHPELHAHAWHGVPSGPIKGMDRDAWPLPDYVRAHLSDKTTQSWW